MKLEIEELKKSMETVQQQVEEARQSLKNLQEELQRANAEYELKKVSAILSNSKQMMSSPFLNKYLKIILKW